MGMYDTLIVAGLLDTESSETRRKLRRFLWQGGNVVITRDSLRNVGPLLGAAAADGGCKALGAGTEVSVVDAAGQRSVLAEPHPFELCPLDLPPNATVLATVGQARLPAAARIPAAGGGSLLVLAAGSHGITTARLPETPQRRGCGPYSRTTGSTFPGEWPGP